MGMIDCTLEGRDLLKTDETRQRTLSKTMAASQREQTNISLGAARVPASSHRSRQGGTMSAPFVLGVPFV